MMFWGKYILLQAAAVELLLYLDYAIVQGLFLLRSLVRCDKMLVVTAYDYDKRHHQRTPFHARSALSWAL